ncbi:hypothetical protein [Paenibacillus ihuae]|uniref:hypothetical protein n=1 Tax=Paenibacillus ihuae TaxID=1232431 RepID=UPI0006D554AE|nr:hypothetical protein [Paenibacillus ihuae]
MYLAKMDAVTFQTLSDERLGRHCMEPAFALIRGKSPEVKAEVIAQLSRGQKALCMFRVFFDHAHKSAAEYYAWISYMLDTPGYWNGVQEGLLFFEDTAMILLLEETRRMLELRNNRLGLQWSEAAFKDMEQDLELARQIRGLYERFGQLSGQSLANIAAYIRTHPEEFVELS